MSKRILIACEESQVITKKFRAKGFEAYSCDIIDCSGGHPEWHLKQDVTPLLKERWDLVIAHPPCTHLSVSGAKHFKNKRESGVQLDAIHFFMECLNANSDKLCVENPIGIISGNYIKKHYPQLCEKYNLPIKQSQIIQPYQFGDPYQKSTCLWLKNLPKLKHTKIVDKGEMHITPSGKVLPKWYSNCKNRKVNRSKTFNGIAEAIVNQWSVLL